MFCRPHLNMSMQPESASVSHTNAEGLGVAGRADNNLDNLQVVHVAQPLFGPEEKIAFSHVLDDGWVTMGSRVRAFELAFAERHGVTDAVAVSSCTAGLHLTLAALGIGPGDEVLVPSLTFVATANSVLYAGASPVFVDISSMEFPLMCLEDAAEKCSSRTKAVIVVLYAGCVEQRRAWREFASQRGLFLIADAAHAAGLEDAASFGDASVFSFYGNKNMTTAEGGMVVSNCPEFLGRCRQMRSHGMTSGTFERHQSGAPRYDVTMLGYNYRMDELRGALGLIQLGRLDAWNERRRVLTAHYREALAANCPTILVPDLHGSNSAHHIMPILLPADTDRDQVIASLRADNIQTSIHYPPIHKFSFYKTLMPQLDLRKTEEFARRELTLPLHPAMHDRDIERVVRSLAVALARS